MTRYVIRVTFEELLGSCKITVASALAVIDFYTVDNATHLEQRSEMMTIREKGMLCCYCARGIEELVTVT